MQKNINNLTKTFIKIGFIATFAFAFAATVNVSVNKDFSLSAAVALADDAGGGGGDGGCCGGGSDYGGGGYDAGTGSDYGNSIGTGGSDGGSSYTTTVYTPVYVAPTTSIYPAPATITVGSGSTLTWSSTNATSCVLNGGQFSNTPVGIYGSTAVYPSATTQYSVRCTGAGGSSTSYTTVTVTQVATAVTADINTSPKTITSGAASTLSWTSTGATYCVLNGGQFNNQNVGVNGSMAIYPTATVNYTITCHNGTNSATDTDYVTVNNVVNNPTATITANPSTITNGNNTMLTWSSTNATYCVLNGGQFSNYRVAVSGSVSASPTVGTNYTVTCYNDAGASAASTTYVNVTTAACTNGATNAPYCNLCPAGQTLVNNVCTVVVNSITADINVNPGSITSGSAATLSWNSTNATYCVLNGGQFNNQTVAVSGSTTIYPTANTSYTIQCYNAAGQNASDNAYISVTTANNLPTVTIYPSQYSITSGGQVTLNWSSANASYCSATPWPYSGSKSLSGSELVTLHNTKSP
jgi:hypothetical protein